MMPPNSTVAAFSYKAEMLQGYTPAFLNHFHLLSEAVGASHLVNH